jgi:hypothetical protein
MKRCSTCKKTLPDIEFYRCARRKDGLQNGCKACSLLAVKAYQTKNGRSRIARSVRYGLSLAEVDHYLSVPACQCCQRPFASEADMRIDHCHDGGHVRGVICNPCNMSCNGAAIEAISRARCCENYLLRDLERQL